jgi:hypothetical protein
MARIKLEHVVEQLDSDMKRALEDAFSKVAPEISVGRNELYREFRRSVGRKFSTWVNVRDSYVQKTCTHCHKDA